VFKKVSKDNVEVLVGSDESLGINDEINSIIRISTGEIAYSKQHLIPFGEYVPRWFRSFRSLLPSLRMDNLQTDRSKAGMINFKNIKIAPSICFEMIFGDELRHKANSANLSLNLSDLGWFKNRYVKSYLLKVAQVRAMETQKPMVYVTNKGISAFIDHNGNIMEQYSKNATAALYHDVIPYQGQTLYTQFGSFPLVLLCCVFVLAGLRMMAGRQEKNIHT
jgi:apolipoprotein N-acyltransferase